MGFVCVSMLPRYEFVYQPCWVNSRRQWSAGVHSARLSNNYISYLLMPSLPYINKTTQDKTKHDTPRQDKTREDTAKNKTRPHHPLIFSKISVGVCMSSYAHTHSHRYLRKHETVVGPETKQETQHSCRQDKTRQDKTRQDMTRQDMTRQDKTRP